MTPVHSIPERSIPAALAYGEERDVIRSVGGSGGFVVSAGVAFAALESDISNLTDCDCVDTDSLISGLKENADSLSCKDAESDGSLEASVVVDIVSANCLTSDFRARDLWGRFASRSRR